MTDTIIKGTGNSRSLRTAPNALTLYPTHEDMLRAMIDGTFPIDLGPLNPLGVDVMGTPLDAEHIVTIEQGSYYGTNKRGPSNPVSLTFSVAPKLILVFATDGSYTYNTPGFGFIVPLQSVGVSIHQQSSSIGVVFRRLNVNTEGTAVKWYYGSDSNNEGGTQLNGPTNYYYTAFL